MPRVVVLGCGTGVGKTRVSVALLRELARSGQACIGLKPIESGLEARTEAIPVTGSDASALANASSFHVLSEPHPLYALPQPVSPHLAARSAGVEIGLGEVASWVERSEKAVTPLVASRMALWTVVESAGGVFSPLSPDLTNFELALALEPATWVLVAGDWLGVLHDLSATLQAMRVRGRVPEHVVLSAARAPDASTGGNAGELHVLGIVTPTAALARDDDCGIQDLVKRLLADALRVPSG